MNVRIVQNVGSHLVSQHIFGVLRVGGNTLPIMQTRVSENSWLAIKTLLGMFSIGNR